MASLKILKSVEEYAALIDGSQNTAVLAFLSKNSTKSMEAEMILSRLAQQSGTPVWGVNVSETREIHPLLSIDQVPTVVTIQNGVLIKKVVGLQTEGTYRKLLSQAPRLREDETVAPLLQVTVYTTRTCPHCTTVKNHLTRKGVPFKEVDVSRDTQAASDLQRRTGRTGVPQTDINGTFVLGANIPQINKLIGI